MRLAGVAMLGEQEKSLWWLIHRLWSPGELRFSSGGAMAGRSLDTSAGARGNRSDVGQIIIEPYQANRECFDAPRTTFARQPLLFAHSELVSTPIQPLIRLHQ